MVLVDRHGLTRQSLPAVAASRAAAKKQRRHRVVIESVGQKKLKTTISFEARPPNGYTFIPAGNPDLTTALKEASRETNQQIYAVSASPHAQVHDLSKEVHRIGFHFPTVIVAQVCAQYGITLTSKGIVAEDNADTFRQMRQKGGWNNGQSDDKKKDQKTVNTEARSAIKDLFPKIPDNDLYTIIKGAFQKGQKKVGTANELPLIRRAQLSVVAHVRHVYTKYDRLLRSVGYREARSQVEGPTLKKLVEWRGDDDNSNGGNQALEDVFREVIVLSDDEDSDDDTDDVVEVVSTKAKGWPLPSHHSVANYRPLSPRQYDYQSGDDNVPGYRVIAQAPRRQRAVDRPSRNEPSQYRQSRYAAWDRAREEYRANPSAVPIALVPLSQHDPKFYYQDPEFNFNDPPTSIRQDYVDIRRREPHTAYLDRQVLHNYRPMKQEFVRGADGHLYERIHTQPHQVSAHERRHEISPPYVSSQPPSPRHALFHEGHDPRAQAISSNVLPSIEDSQPLHLDDGRSRAIQNDYRVDQPSNLYETRQLNTRPRNVEVIDLTDNADAQFAKRRRVEGPSGARRIFDVFNDEHRLLDNPVTVGGRGRPALEPQHHGREIIDLSSPNYIRDPLPGGPRRAPDRRPVCERVQEGQGIRSGLRAVHSVADIRSDDGRTRYARGPDPVHGESRDVGLGSPPMARHDGHLAYGMQSELLHRVDAEYRPEDPAIRSENGVARRAAVYRNVTMPTVGVPAYDDESVSYTRKYIPVIRNEALMPDAVPHDTSQQRRPAYVDSPRGLQHYRYEFRRYRYPTPDAGRPPSFLSSRLTQN